MSTTNDKFTRVKDDQTGRMNEIRDLSTMEREEEGWRGEIGISEPGQRGCLKMKVEGKFGLNEGFVNGTLTIWP